MTAGNRRKESEAIVTSLHLPFDLVTEILCRLPVKHLVPLRCVSKSWNSLISADSKFAKKHLRLSTSSHDRHHLILTPTHSSPEFPVLCFPISSIFSSTFTTTVKQFSYSIREILIKGAYANRASTCDGMLCFKIDASSALLCNPSIRKLKILPPLNLPKQLFTLYTLVYDRFTNNYKIIVIYSTLGRKYEVNVHTVGTDYWRKIQDFPNPLFAPVPGIFVSDSVYWLVYDGGADVTPLIVSLDLEKESYQNLSLPFKHAHFTTSLGTLRGCLSLLSQRDKFYDVWIMKEYGNEKSWTKLLSVPYMKECEVTRALDISKNDQVLMEFHKDGKFNLVVYDFINNIFKTSKFQYSREYATTLQVYVESLISPF
ncbi:unnamed protein product [Lathyrus sativus]|nr:unnamed protein product [Lathyrus sativus]